MLDVKQICGEEMQTIFANDNKRSTMLHRLKAKGNLSPICAQSKLIKRKRIREQTPLDTIDFALVCEKPGLMAFTKEYRAVKLGGGAE